MHVTRAANTLRAIAHDSKAHAVAVKLFIKTLTVILYRQHHLPMTACELDQHLASSTVLDSVTHCFLSNPVKLSRYWPTNWQRGAIGFNHALHTAILTYVHGERLQGRFQIAHAISAL